MLKPNEYRCADCGGVFQKTDFDAEAELERSFPGFTPADCELVCDDCYKRYSP